MKKRGPKGLFTVFKVGKKGYARVFPGKKRLILSNNADPAVERGLVDALHLFAGIHVQNNICETTNNVLQSMISLKGNHSIEKLTRRIRSFYTINNNDLHIPATALYRRHGPAPFFTRAFNVDYNTFLEESKMELRVIAM